MNYITFVKKARKVHQDKFSYPQWPGSIGYHTRVKIVCPLHGEFFKTIAKHIYAGGQGCPVCSKIKSSGLQCLSVSDVMAKATTIHQGEYTYPKHQPQYKNTTSQLKVVCHDPLHPPEGLEFSQRAANHLKGHGCPVCAAVKNGKTQQLGFGVIVATAQKIHEGLYAYPFPQQCKKSHDNIRVLCLIHGEFTTSVTSHLRQATGCPRCAKERAWDSTRDSLSNVIAKATLRHDGRYKYDSGKTVYTNNSSLLHIICSVHGEFKQQANSHLMGCGCPACGDIATAASRTIGIDEVIRRGSLVHSGKFQYSEDQGQYTGTKSEIRVVCPRHGEFLQNGSNHLQGKGCPKCVGSISQDETDMLNFIKTLGFQPERGNESNVPGLGRYELDIILKDQKIAFEYNGLYWHSEDKRLSPRVHLDKTLLAESLGYRLIHVFSDEWKLKRSLVEARLRAILGKETKRVFARKTELVKLDNKNSASFLKATHLQGAGPKARVCLGLEAKGELVAAATFGKARYGNEGWELLRFASRGVVVGGASKLLHHFKSGYMESGQQLISFANRCWSQGDVYKKLGFEFEGYTKPGYSYTKGVTRMSRERFQKHKLAKLFNNFDPSLTEVVNCGNNGYYRVFDCGNSKWSLRV